MQQAIDGIRTAKSKALQLRVRRKEGKIEKGDIPWDIVILGYPLKTPKQPGSNKENFSVNFLQIFSSNFDETGCSKRKGENLEETLRGEKRKRTYLRNSEYEGNIADHPNIGGSPSHAAGPNDAEKATDKQEKDTP